MNNVMIAGYARSPFHFARKGGLAKVRPDDLAAQVVTALVERTRVDPATVEDVIMGCAMPEGEQGLNIARLVAFLAKLPEGVAGTTVNRFCGSSMQAIHMAAGAIRMGAGDAFICAGIESMTRVPMTGFNPSPNPRLVKDYPAAYISMGQTAENLARKHQVTRAEQEQLAVASQQKAAAARAANRFRDEIVPIVLGDGSVVAEDGCIRPETTAAILAALAPAFDADGTVTAGTSSPLTDGASATLVCSEAYATRNNLDVLAAVKSIAVAGCAPEIMGYGPVPATRKALQRAGIAADQLDVIELNEAFASQAIVCIRDLNLDDRKINLDGGAIALGHPLGATGARITGKAAALLRREEGKYALATQCIGGGQGIATVLERA